MKGNRRKGVSLSIVTLMLLLAFILTSSSISYAETMSDGQKDEGILTVNKDANYSLAFQNWINLPESQRDKYIEPNMYGTPYYVKKNYSPEIFAALRAATRSSSYDLRNDISIQVKDQQQTQSCWTFPIISTVETNISLTRGYQSPIFSARHMEYATSKTFLDGINPNGYNREVGSGGNVTYGLSYYISGQGPVLENDMPFINSEAKINLSGIDKQTGQKIESYVNIPSIYKINGAYQDASGNTLSEEQVNTIREQIKAHIIAYGGVTANTNSSQTQFFNNISPILATAYYCNDNSITPDHLVTIVGWDDNYSRNNFNEANRPSKDGAWLVLNSYGTGFNGGYYYISYEDVMVERENAGVIKVVDRDYKNLYQHDVLAKNFNFGLNLTNNQDGTSTPVKTLYAANVYTRKESQSELLKEIAITGADTNTINIYVNPTGALDLTSSTLVASNVTLNDEYKTFKINNPITLTSNQFAVIVQYTGTQQARAGVEMNLTANGYETSKKWDTATGEAGECFVSTTGATDSWQDLTELIQESSFCIKAFTTVNDSQGPTIEFEPMGNTEYQREQGSTVRVTDTNGVNASTLRYVWTQSTSQPLSSEFENGFVNNTRVINNTDTGNDWYLWVMAKDILGNVKYARSNAFYLDNTAPTAPTITSNVTSNVFTKENAEVSVNGSYALSGIARYEYTVDNGNTWTPIEGTISVTRSGTYRLKARAISNTGITGVESQEFIIRIDKDPPVISGIDENGIYQSVTPTITDQTTMTAYLTKDGVERNYIIDATNKGETINETGTYRLVVTDAVGNETVINFKVDVTSPEVIFTPNGDTNYKKVQSTVVTVTDQNEVNASSLKYLWLRDIQDVSESLFENDNGKPFKNGDTINLSDVSGSDYALCVIAKDEVGNTTVTLSNPFYIDNITPNAPVMKSNVSNGSVTNEDFYFTIGGSEAPSGIKTYQYSLDGGATWFEVKEGEEVRFQESGTYTVIARAISNMDVPGSETVPYTVTISKEAPRILFTPNGSSAYKKEQSTIITIEHSQTLEAQSFKYLWTKQETQPTEAEFTEQFYEGGRLTKDSDSGIWYIWAMASDELGNRSITRSEGFYLDNDIPNAPTITSNAPHDTYIGERANISLSGSHSTSGIVRYEYSMDGQVNWIPVAENEVHTLPKDGCYEIYAVAINAVGTRGDVAGSYIIKMDTTPPVIKGVEDGKAYSGVTPVIEDDTEVIMKLEKDGVEVPYQPGDEIDEPGNYKLIAEDELGNTQEIEFTIDSEGPVITFNPNENRTYAKTQSTIVEVTDAHLDPSTVRYKWTQSVQVLTEGTFMPDSIPFESGDELSKGGVTGDNWYLWIYAKDTLGNMSLVKSGVFYLDNEIPNAPTITASVASDVYTSEDVTVQISGSSAPSGIAKYQYSIDNGYNWIDVAVGETITLTESGNYNMIARAVSNVGIEGRNGNAYIIRINKGEPVVSFSPNGNKTYGKSQSTRVDVTVAGEVSNIKYIWSQKAEGVTKEEVTQEFINGQMITKNTESGAWFLWIYAQDSLGNEALRKSNAFYLDNEIPEAPKLEVSVPSGSVVNEGITIKISGSSAPSGIAKYQYSLNNGASWVDLLPNQEARVEISGSYRIKARAVNNVGTEGKQTQEEYSVTISRQDMIVAFVPEEDVTYRKEQSSQVVVESELPIGSIQYLWSKEETGITEEDFTGQTLNNGDLVIKNTESGAWYLWILAKDQVGNKTIARSGLFYLDNEVPNAPTITKKDLIEEDKVELTVDGSNSPSGIKKYQYSLNNGTTWVDLPVGEKVILELGTYEVKTRAINKVDTIGVESGLQYIEVFSKVPTIIFTPDGNPKYEQTQSTKIKVTSSLALQEDSLKYLWTSEAEGITAEDITQGFLNGSTVTGELNDGKLYVWAIAKNVQGDTKIQRSEAFYFDNTPPVIRNVENNGNYEEAKPIIEDESPIKIEVIKDGEPYDYEQGDVIEEEGIYQIIVVDEADNKTEVSFIIEHVEKDITGPLVFFTPNGNTKYQKSQSTVVRVEDESGVKGESLKFLWSKSTEKPSKDKFVSAFENKATITNNKDTGKLYLWVYAEDTLGNTSILRSDVFYLDNVKPGKPDIEANVEDGDTTDGDVVMDISGGEEESKVEYEYSTDGGKTWDPVENDRVVITEEGEYEVYIRSKNEVGEVSDPTIIHFIIDKTPEPVDPKPEQPEDPDGSQKPQEPDDSKDQDNTQNSGGNKQDDTVAPFPIPQAGLKEILMIITIAGLMISIIAAGIKIRKIKLK